ncbi:hypothetical protein M9H77_33047 [Catharanthus roseus]|uniref:Uncharacterized protein n=1 Tax=Catharanthus roseus TaxID=4058 RepID=A0ACC0A626_CATRO|nr:hypothetical protein M9H77_33047 [Catharanthus roseus]
MSDERRKNNVMSIKLIAFLGKQFRLRRKQNALCELLELIVKNDPVDEELQFRELPYYRFLLLSKLGKGIIFVLDHLKSSLLFSSNLLFSSDEPFTCASSEITQEVPEIMGNCIIFQPLVDLPCDRMLYESLKCLFSTVQD